jgi:small subunit ribosomal protein S20
VAHSLSAKKRIRQNSKQRARNRAHRGSIRTQIKKFQQLVRSSSEVETLEKELQVTQKKIDQLKSKGRIHKNTAARQKSQLARRVNAAKAKTP